MTDILNVEVDFDEETNEQYLLLSQSGKEIRLHVHQAVELQELIEKFVADELDHFSSYTIE